MNNSTFGKKMKNLRQRINVRLVKNAGNYKKYVSKPSFVSRNIFNKKLFAIHETKPIDKRFIIQSMQNLVFLI